MLTKKMAEKEYARGQWQMLCIDDCVPKNHILRDIDKALDFSFVYDEVADLYSFETGRPSVDPVVLVKIVMIQYLFGIRSMRQTIKDIEVNLAYRWFLGFDFRDKIPHFGTFSKNYARRFANSDIFEKIFFRILEEAVSHGFVDTSAVFLDGTHVKASANKKKSTNEEVLIDVKNYQKELEAEIKLDREKHGKKPPKDKDEPPKTKNTKQSTTDPECGLFHKGEHKVDFAYTASTVCDKNGYVLDFELAPGNTHDSVMFDELYARVLQKFPDIKAIGLDAGYKIPWIMKQVFESGVIPCVPYKRPHTKRGYFYKRDYVYDEFYDCVICPKNQILKYSTTNKLGYKEYKSDPKICINCPNRAKCTESKNCQKVFVRHVWKEFLDMADDVRLSPFGKKTYALRSQTIERIFADAKEKHNMRYTQFRGKQRVRLQVLLTFACMNLKKLAKWKRIKGFLPPLLQNFWDFFFFPIEKEHLAFA